MADTLFKRVTGATTTDPVRVNLDLVMTDRTFFDTSHEAAHLPGYGPVPAGWGLARFITRRDQDLCRTPWCGAPITQIDHVSDWAHGGTTSATNTQGFCARCNLAKQALGWRAKTLPGSGRTRRHTVHTTTPTGHTYPSRAPAPPGHLDISSPLEQLLLDLTG